MWKNKTFAKRLRGVYVVYEITGVNLDRFINVVKNRGVTVYDAKKTSQKRLIISVSYADSLKFFAIAKELCYNIKKVKEKGRAYPLLKLARSLGLIVGAVIFVVTATVLDDTLFCLTFSGTGSVCKSQVEQYLYDNGVKPLARFSSLDLEGLEDGILANNSRLSFVACQKRGSRLNIELVLSKEQVQRLDGNVYAMYSTVDGVVENIKVYRGTAKVLAGDVVKKGDLIVDGYATVKDQTVKINVLATANILVTQTFTYRSVDQNAALTLAMEELSNRDIVKTTVEKTDMGGMAEYTVQATYRTVITVG